jgi:hypothetical protein
VHIPVEYYCKYCKFTTPNKHNFATHNKTAKHHNNVINFDNGVVNFVTTNGELKPIAKYDLETGIIASRTEIELGQTKEELNKIKEKLTKAKVEIEQIKNDHKVEMSSLILKYKNKIKINKEKYIKDIAEQREKYIEAVEKSKNEIIEQKDKYMSEIVEQKDKHINDMVGQRDMAMNNMNTTMTVCAEITKKSVETVKSALTYANTNFNNAPILTKINNFECFDDRDIIDELLNNYNDDIIHKYIGNIIIELYKKENAKDQSLWNTDSSRFAYIIRKKTKKDPIWDKDPNTETIEKLIIAPLVEYFIDTIDDKRENIYKFIKKKSKSRQ